MAALPGLTSTSLTKEWTKALVSVSSLVLRESLISSAKVAMVSALFKSWFVEFEPVRAKMEGRWRRDESLPGLPADLYDLFPERLVDSELRGIPER